MTARAPVIVSRAAWGANPLVTPASRIATPTRDVWLHHTGGEQFGAAGMRMLQQFTLHRPNDHYVDLEYTFVVDRASCTIYNSRGVGKNSAATLNHNETSSAICVMGVFDVDGVSDQLIETLANLCAWGYEQGWWMPCGFTGGHRDVFSTDCPGNHLYAAIPRINARAVEIHNGAPTPTPPPEKVKPMYVPTLQVAAVWEGDDRSAIGGVSPDGHVYAWERSFRDLFQQLGGSGGKGEPANKDYWGSRTAANIRAWAPGDHGDSSYVYTIVATDGALYSYGPKT